MNTSEIEAKIKNVDWEKYSGPEYYDSARLVNSLIALANNNESNFKNGLINEVLFSVGNNHAGTYYPAILEAAEIIIEIEKNSEIEGARKSAWAILNDLYYFGAEVGEYKAHSYEEIESIVKKKLKPYEDET